MPPATTDRTEEIAERLGTTNELLGLLLVLLVLAVLVYAASHGPAF